MSLLLDLPEEIIYEVLGSWVVPWDIQGFDTALCNYSSNLRSRFLDSVSNPVFVVETKQILDYYGIVWASSKMVKLKYVELDSFHLISPPLALQNCTFCSQTVCLTLKKCSKVFLSVSTLIKLINACPKLTEINFFQVESFNDECVTSINSDILKQLKHFKAFNAEKSDCLEQEFIFTPLSNVGRLSLVRCENLIQLSGDAIFTPDLTGNNTIESKNLSCQIMNVILCLNRTLTQLIQVDFDMLDDTFFISLMRLKILPNLQRLTIINFIDPTFGLNVITELLSVCPNIEVFILVFSDHRRIEYSCSRVNGDKNINFHNVLGLQANTILPLFFEHTTDFNEIRMVGCSKEIVDGDVLRIIAKNNPNLVSLKIDESCIDHNNITRDDFKCLVDQCPKLQKLHMYQYNFLSSDDWKFIFALRSDNEPHNFTYLNFANHRTLDYDTLTMIAVNCPKLTLLCVDLCGEIDDNKAFRQFMSVNHNNVICRDYHYFSEGEMDGDNLEGSSASSSDSDNDIDDNEIDDEDGDI